MKTAFQIRMDGAGKHFLNGNRGRLLGSGLLWLFLCPLYCGGCAQKTPPVSEEQELPAVSLTPQEPARSTSLVENGTGRVPSFSHSFIPVGESLYAVQILWGRSAEPTDLPPETKPSAARLAALWNTTRIELPPQSTSWTSPVLAQGQRFCVALSALVDGEWEQSPSPLCGIAPTDWALRVGESREVFPPYPKQLGRLSLPKGATLLLALEEQAAGLPLHLEFLEIAANGGELRVQSPYSKTPRAVFVQAPFATGLLQVTLLGMKGAEGAPGAGGKQGKDGSAGQSGQSRFQSIGDLRHAFVCIFAPTNGTDAENGSPGSAGGVGSAGGASPDFTITVAEGDLELHTTVLPGQGGRGGNGGPGGLGGRGGAAGVLDKQKVCPRAQAGRNGVAGATGPSGPSAQNGEPGRVCIGLPSGSSPDCPRTVQPIEK